MKRFGTALDLVSRMLPALLFVAYIDYAAWCAWI